MREHIDDFNQLATYDFRNYSQKKYKTIIKTVARKFDLEYIAEPINTKDYNQQTFRKEDKWLSIEWEFLVGFGIYSKTINANDLAKEIAEFVNTKYSSHHKPLIFHPPHT